MNTIKAAVDISEYGYGSYLNYRLDGCWLDEKLEDLYPGNWCGGTIPTLLFGMENENEERVVWQRILPQNEQPTNCPILMCPDDNDFSCTIIIAKIVANERIVKWEKIGVDQTREYEPDKVGTTVKWFDEIAPLEFERSGYLQMIEAFKNEFVIDKENWKKKAG